MKKCTLIVLIPLLLSGRVNAQSDFKPGFIIMNNNDTINGMIDNRGYKSMAVKCRFKAEETNSVTEYHPGDISEYCFTDGKRYVSRTLESGVKVFLEYLVNGELNLYYYRNTQGLNIYVIDKLNFPLKEIPYTSEERYRDDGTRVLYQSKYHIGLLQAYTNDAVGFQEEPARLSKLDHKNLIKFAEDYHNIVCKDSSCIIYEKNTPILKASAELLYGQTYIYGDYDYDKDFTGEFGLGVYLWMPRVSERVYFRTGIKYRQMSMNDEKLNFILIPIGLQYQYSHYDLIPKIFLGFQSYFAKDKEVFYTINAGTGLDYRFTDRITVTSNFEAEIIPFIMRLDGWDSSYQNAIGFISGSIQIGFKYDLISLPGKTK